MTSKISNFPSPPNKTPPLPKTKLWEGPYDYKQVSPPPEKLSPEEKIIALNLPGKLEFPKEGKSLRGRSLSY